MLSCQNDEYTDISALVNIQLTKDTDTGEVWISDVSYKPIYMADLYDYGINDYGWHYRMVDLHAAINSYESGTPGNSSQTKSTATWPTPLRQFTSSSARSSTPP